MGADGKGRDSCNVPIKITITITITITINIMITILLLITLLIIKTTQQILYKYRQCL